MSIARKELCDLFIISGGINGAAVACDAAGPGLSVALAEEHDFAEVTLSRSSKMLHESAMGISSVCRCASDGSSQAGSRL